MLKSQMEVSRDLADEANPFLSINVTDSDEEQAGNEIFILDADESDGERIYVEGIWKDTLLSNLFIFSILIFMSYEYVEESFFE